MGLRRLIWRAARVLPPALVLASVTDTALALDDGDPGAGARWEAGRILVRFADGADERDRERMAGAADVEIVDQLPLVPNLYEVETRARVAIALERLTSARDVLYAQPDYVDDAEELTGPGDPGYWPNDPYFWPARFENPDNCRNSDQLDGWPFWRQGGDLTALGAAGAGFSPLPLDQRITVEGGAFPTHHSINVLPVWNLLRAKGRLGERGERTWSAADLQRYAVAVDDTGISDHPDLRGPLAALFSTVTSTEVEGATVGRRDRIREVFRDDPRRDDLETVRAALRAQGLGATQVEDTQRPLFTLDDPAVQDPQKWKPEFNVALFPPRGCDGHGTAVASVAAARANNNTGTAGVGYDVPVVGLRVGMPWDRRGVGYARPGQVDDAIDAWRSWRTRAEPEVTDESRILRYEVVRALRLPVLNMSHGSDLGTYLRDDDGDPRIVVFSPAVAEALARTLSTGWTLGIAAAGNHLQQFGRGRRARGADIQGVPGIRKPAALPCGLKLLPILKVWTSKDVLDPTGRRINPDATPDEPFRPPDLDWDRVELLCVAATHPQGMALVRQSARGDSVVQLAAPGVNLTVANRPSTSAADASGAYHRGDGTSYSAPMVAGAAGLLRRAAPRAPIDEIRRALERGARPASGMRGKVKYGVLDVACALRMLNARKQPDWDMIAIDPTPDAEAHRDFLAATDRCREQPSRSVEWSLLIRTARAFDEADDVGRHPTMQAFVDSAKLEAGPGSPSLAWQRRLIGDGPWEGGRAVFPIQPGPPTPVAPPARPVYEAGFINPGCSDPGYQITGLSLAFTSAIKPHGWVFPTDAQPTAKHVQLAVALAKPWYRALLPDFLHIRAKVRCDYFPGLD